MNRRKSLTPATVDALERGALLDPLTLGLSIEVLSSGKKAWKFRRRLANAGTIVKLTLGTFPAHTIANARSWATELNAKVEAGIDPREDKRKANDRAKMTVAVAHSLYMTAVREGRASRAKRLNRPRTIAEKLAIYDLDIAPKLSTKVIYDVVESDLTKLVIAKGKVSRCRANRLAGELKVFFGWASSLRGMEIGLDSNPSLRLTDLKFAETPRTRRLTTEEIGWFLQALTHEPRTYQRGLLLLLLTAARISEVIGAKSSELQDGVWVIPENRAKNGCAHRIALGPWGMSLFQSNGVWAFPSKRLDTHRVACGFYKARDRVLAQMSQFAGRPIEPWTPHDMRRTVRSNTKRLKVDYETAEAMLNHTKKGLERIYDGYDLEEEKREAFLKWETEIVAIAKMIGVSDALGVPSEPTSEVSSWTPTPYYRRHFTRGRGFPSRPERRHA